MSKWYQSAPCKGILLVLEHICAVVTVVCLVWMLAYSTGGLAGAIFEEPKGSYAETEAFEEQLRSIAGEVVWAEPWVENYETEGVYDENKIVDIKEYIYEDTISGENKSGLAYRLGDLAIWGERGYTEVYDDEGGNIIVCKKADGSYQYYYKDEFQKLVEDGDIVFSTLDEVKETYDIYGRDEMVEALIYGWIPSSEFKNLLDAEGKVIFTSCWVYDGFEVEEEFAPIGAENILEIVNNDSNWNGKLTEAMDLVSSSIDSISMNIYSCQSVQERWSEGNSNVYYLLVDKKTGEVFTNRTEFQRADDWKKNIEKMKELGKYAIVTPKLAEFESNMTGAAEIWKSIIKSSAWAEDYVCAFAVDTTYPVQDQFYQENQMYEKYAPGVRRILGGGIAATLGFLVCLIWLTAVSGHSNKEEGISLFFFDRIKTEVFLMAAGILTGMGLAGVAAMCESIFYYGEYYQFSTNAATGSTGYVVSTGSSLVMEAEEIFLLGVMALLFCAAASILWFGMVRRIKAKTIWKNSLTRWLLNFARTILVHMKLLWKIILAFGGFALLHWIACLSCGDGIWIGLMFFAEILAFVYLIRDTIGRNKIKEGVTNIANGDVTYQIPLKGLNGDQLAVAEQINQIGDGLERAVENSMKNERMKTDLITNVSHDIKTPLTSIINYVELLKRENFEDPKIQNYIQVLEEKALRMKTLTEDVVEASKVSSGNIKLEKMNLNLVELINQAYAELEEKFTDRNLNLVMNLPEEPAIVYADGRRIWRILANVFNNAAKYAMEGTRVYADLFQNDKEVQFTLKNISDQQLNISADELTERFIRGDVSRSTEGSGLGLSIAKNLTELQGGTFELYLDGDLFKVLICFPKTKG